MGLDLFLAMGLVLEDRVSTKTDTRTKPEVGVPTDKPPRHLVERDRNGVPEDKALCGFLWDRLDVQHNGSICEHGGYCADNCSLR